MADQAGSGSLPAVAELLGYLWGCCHDDSGKQGLKNLPDACEPKE